MDYAALVIAVLSSVGAWLSARTRAKEKSLEFEDHTEARLFQRISELETRQSEIVTRYEDSYTAAVERESDLRQRIVTLEHDLLATKKKLVELQSDYDAQSQEVSELRRKNRLLDGQNRALHDELNNVRQSIAAMTGSVRPPRGDE